MVGAFISVLVPARLSNTALFLRCRMIVRRNIIDTPFDGPTRQVIMCSNEYSTPKSYKQYYRYRVAEDPWLSYYDHGKSSMMYGEACKYAILDKGVVKNLTFFICSCTCSLSSFQWSLRKCAEEWYECLDLCKFVLHSLLIMPFSLHSI